MSEPHTSKLAKNHRKTAQTTSTARRPCTRSRAHRPQSDYHWSPYDPSSEGQQRERLRKIMAEEERRAKMRREARDATKRKHEAVDIMLRKVRYETGFHVDTWPPNYVEARLVVRTIPDVADEDRIPLTIEQIDKFQKRKKYIPEENDDSVVIVVEDDQVIARMKRLMEKRKSKVIVITEFDLRLKCQAWVEAQLRKFANGEFDVFICTIELEFYNMIPFAKFTVFNKVYNGKLFNSFCTRQSERSRTTKKTSIIDVTLSYADSPRLVSSVVELMYMREDYPTEAMLQFIEDHCWSDQPLERRIHDQWRTNDTLINEREKKEIIEKIGEFQEKWWENPEIVEKVRKHVVPMKEIQTHLLEPSKRLVQSCLRNCEEYQRVRQARRRVVTPPVPLPVRHAVFGPRTPPGSPPADPLPLEHYLFRQHDDEPSFINIPGPARGGH